MNMRTTNKYLGKVVRLDTDGLATSWNVIGQAHASDEAWGRGLTRNHYHLQNRLTGELATIHQKRLILLDEDALVLF